MDICTINIPKPKANHGGHKPTSNADRGPVGGELPRNWKCVRGRSLASKPKGFSSSMLMKFRANIPAMWDPQIPQMLCVLTYKPKKSSSKIL